jgi:hypothetical protein
VEASALSWEQDLLSAQRAYVERQLRAGVARPTIVRDLVDLGADSARAAHFVALSATDIAAPGRRDDASAGLGFGAYLLRAGLAWTLATAVGAGLLLGAGLAVTSASIAAGVPALSSLGRIEAVSLIPGVVVGVVLRRFLAASASWRAMVAGFCALSAILVLRLLTLVEITHEAVGNGRTALLTDHHFLRSFVMAPTDVYGLWDSDRVGPLILWDVGFVALAAFVAAVFSHHPLEE